jgi:general stress protein 26
MTEYKKLAHMIQDIDFTMMTTLGSDGSLYSRPMSTQKIDEEHFDGKLWFFTKKDSPKVHELEKNQKVNLAYAHTGHHRYVSVAGVANIVLDRQKMKELWRPVYQAWFPEGLEDPQLCLISVDIMSAELWDSPGGKIIQAIGFMKAVLTGKPLDHAGENQQINFHH